MTRRKHPSSHQRDIRGTGANRKRRNIMLDQEKIDAAREILGAASDAATIDEALSIVIYGHRLAEGTRAMVGEEYVDVLGIASEEG